MGHGDSTDDSALCGFHIRLNSFHMLSYPISSNFGENLIKGILISYICGISFQIHAHTIAVALI